MYEFITVCWKVVRLRSRSHIWNPNRDAYCSTFTSWRVWTHEHFFTKCVHRSYLWHEGGVEMGLSLWYEMYRPVPLCEETLYWNRGVTKISKIPLLRGEPISMLHSIERVGSQLYLYQPWVHCGTLYCHQIVHNVHHMIFAQQGKCKVPVPKMTLFGSQLQTIDKELYSFCYHLIKYFTWTL